MPTSRIFGFTKTKTGIAIATLVFLALIVFGEFSPLGDFIQKNGITRDDVEKYRIHILASPNLRKIANNLTSLNITAKLTQIGSGRFFRADGGADFHAYFSLNNDWDFEEITDRKAINALKDKIYSFNKIEDELWVNANDKELRMVSESFKYPLNKVKVSFLNYNKSAVLSVEEKVALVQDLNSTALKFLDFGKPVEELIYDPYDTRVFAKVDSKAGASVNSDTYSYKLALIDTKEKSLNAKLFDVPLGKESKVSYNSKAAALTIVDREKIRVLDSNSGKVREIIHFKTLFPEQKAKDMPTIVTQPLVPAALLNDQLIDLRDGSIVDTLPGFSNESLFVVDYKNKRMYYSPVQKNGSPSMNIAIYDLHNLRLELQIMLGDKNVEEQGRMERKDKLDDIFIDSQGYVIGVSSPL